MSLRQSTLLPALAHSSAQIFATFSGIDFGGRLTTSTLKPKASSAHLFPRPSYPSPARGVRVARLPLVLPPATPSSHPDQVPSRCVPWLSIPGPLYLPADSAYGRAPSFLHRSLVLCHRPWLSWPTANRDRK